MFDFHSLVFFRSPSVRKVSPKINVTVCRLIFCSIYIIFFAGCSSYFGKASPSAVVLETPIDHRMHFRGKGAAAGMMMAGSMGPMEIAIGVAIDEGIAKTIGKAVLTSDVDIPRLLSNSITQVETQEPKVFVLKEYGFVTTKNGVTGLDDPVIPYWELIDKSSSKLYSSVEHCNPAAIELEIIKIDGMAIRRAYEDIAICAQTVLENIVKS